MNKFYLKLVGLQIYVKISEFLKFIKFEFSVYWWGISRRHHLHDTLLRPTFRPALSFAEQSLWFPSHRRCPACCPCSLNSAAAIQRQLAWAVVINWP